MKVNDRIVHSEGHKKALKMIMRELDKAQTKHKGWPSDDNFHGLAIVGEEYGEMQKAVLDHANGKGSREDVYEETAQAGAMALRFLADLINNE